MNNVLTRSMVEQWQAVLWGQLPLESHDNRAASPRYGGAASVGSQEEEKQEEQEEAATAAAGGGGGGGGGGAAAAAAAAAAPVAKTSKSLRDSR